MRLRVGEIVKAFGERLVSQRAFYGATLSEYAEDRAIQS